MNKKLLLIGIMFLITLGLASALTPETDGVSYYNLSSYGDLWGGASALTKTIGSATNSLTYPSFNISGDSSPNSSYFDGNDALGNTDNPLANIGTGDFTISIWHYQSSLLSANGEIWTFGEDDAGDDDVSGVRINSGTYYWIMADKTTGGNCALTSTSSVSANNWHNLVVLRDTGVVKMYIDGVYNNQVACSLSLEDTDFDNNWGIGKRVGSLSWYFTGFLDELKVYNDSISLTQVQNIYNYGTTELVAVVNFSVSVVDFWDSSDVNSINVTIDGTTYENATGNTITTNILQNNTNNYTIIVNSSSHFTRTFTNIPVSSNYQAIVKGSDIKFKAYEKFTGNELKGNITIGNITKLVRSNFFLNSKIYNITWAWTNSSAFYFPMTEEKTITEKQNATLNISGLYTTNLTIIPRDTFSNASVSGVNITLSYGSLSETFTNVSNASFNLVNTLSYTLTIDSEDYNVSVSSISGLGTGNETKYIYLYKFNSAFFTFYDENLVILSQLVNTTMNSGYNSYTFNTSNGTYYLQEMATGNYDLISSTSGYNDVSLYVTLAAGSYQEVDVYFNDLTLSNKTFIVYDEGRDAVEGAVVSFTRLINGSLIVIEQGTTDFSGSVRVSLSENTKYGLVVSKSRYNTFTGEVTPTEDSYVISITSDNINRFTSSYDDIVYDVGTHYTYNNTYGDLFLETYSAGGYLTYYGYNFTYRGVLYSENITGIPAGGFVSSNITNIDVSAEQKVYATFFFKSVNQSLISWDESFYLVDVVPSDNTLKNGLLDTTGMTDSQLAFVGGIILLLLITLAAGLSKSYLVTSIVGISVTGLLWSKGFFSRELALVSMIVLAVLTIAKLIKSGGS